MVWSVRPLRRSAVVVLVLAVSSLLEACSGGGGKTVAERRAARRRALQSQSVAQTLRNAAAGGAKRDSVTYETARGWIVKGSDFLTFWPCGKSGYYFMRPTAPVLTRISQQYKFSAPRPYSTMFAELQLHYVSDSIRIGGRSYDRYAEVVGYTMTPRDEATCKSPSRTVVSDEMERLDRFKVEVLSR